MNIQPVPAKIYFYRDVAPKSLRVGDQIKLGKGRWSPPVDRKNLFVHGSRTWMRDPDDSDVLILVATNGTLRVRRERGMGRPTGSERIVW